MAILFDASSFNDITWYVNNVAQSGNTFYFNWGDEISYVKSTGSSESIVLEFYDKSNTLLDEDYYTTADYTGNYSVPKDTVKIVVSDFDDTSYTNRRYIGKVYYELSTLANTKWVFNSIIDISGNTFDGGKEIVFKSIITFPNIEEYTYGGFRKRTDYLGETYLVYCLDPTEVDMTEEYAYGETSHWSNQILRIIEITGGNDVTNSTLIQWLEANAVQVQVTSLVNTKWVLNNTINLIPGSYYIDFETDNDTYSYFQKGSIPGAGYTALKYSGNIVYVFDNNTWTDDVYKTITIAGGTDATNPDLIVWLQANGTLTAPQPTPTKTFDLSTLQLSAGTHTVQVKARSQGYRDSNFSNSVSYVVPYEVTGTSAGPFNGDDSFQYSIDGGTTWNSFEVESTTFFIKSIKASQIQFRVKLSTGMISSNIQSETLNFNISSNTSTYVYSSNFTLTQNIDDIHLGGQF